MDDEFKRQMDPGGGGYRCMCCGPVGAAEKKIWRRRARSRLRDLDKKLLLQEDEGEEVSNG